MVISTNQNYESSLELLEKAQALIQIEKLLTETLEKVEPWLPQQSNDHRRPMNPNQPRVRPIPRTMEEVENVLAVARNLASRTSAPAGWNPNAPVVGFSTPAPLPHQLRGGALAALQLARARQSEREEKQKKRQRIIQEQQNQQQKQKQQQQETKDESKNDVLNPKRREINQHEQQIDAARRAQQQRSVAAAAATVNKPKLDVSMNLSDDSDDDSD